MTYVDLLNIAISDKRFIQTSKEKETASERRSLIDRRLGGRYFEHTRNYLSTNDKEMLARSVAMYLGLEVILPKGKSKLDLSNKTYELIVPDTTTKSEQKPEGKEMSQIKITKVTLLNGTDIKKWSKPDLFELIAQTEGKITALKAIKSRPKMLVAEITQMEQALEELVKELDTLE